MKKVVLVLVALAFSLVSNAQDFGQGLYGQIGVNAKEVIGNGNATTELAIGVVTNGLDFYIANEIITSEKSLLSFGAAKVIELKPGAYFNIGGVVGGGIGKGFYYSPDLSLRLHFHDSPYLSAIFQATLPQLKEQGDINLDDPVFRVKLRFNF